MRSSAAVILTIGLLWRTVAVMPDGRIAGTTRPSAAYSAGLRVNDVIEFIERRPFQLDRLDDAARYLIVNRSGKRLLILNPAEKPGFNRPLCTREN